MIYGLEEHILTAIRSIFRSFNDVEEVVLFGSRAKGNYKPASDIDITIKGQLNTSTLNEISWMLDDLMLPYTFDTSIYNHINNPDLIDHINRVGATIYKKQ